MWVRRITFALGIALGLFATAGSVRAGIDFALAGAGSQVPFSQLSDAIPTAWSLLNPTAVSGPSIGRPPADWLDLPANTSEPGRGNPNSLTLGQIVSVGNPAGADRNVWGVYDRLAAVPVPVLLYFDTFSRMLAHPAPLDSSFSYLPLLPGAGGLSGSGGGSASSSGGTFRLPDIIEIPEPASALLLMPAALAFLVRTRNPRHA